MKYINCMYVIRQLYVCNSFFLAIYFINFIHLPPLFYLFLLYVPRRGPTFDKLFDVYIPPNKPINTNKYIYIIHQPDIHTLTQLVIHTHTHTYIYPTPTCKGCGYTPQRLRPLVGANASSGYNLRPYQLCC